MSKTIKVLNRSPRIVIKQVGGNGSGASGNVSSVSNVTLPNQLVVYNNTNGRQIRGATGSGIPKISNGVLGFAVLGTDYLAPNGNGSQLTGITQSQIGGLVSLLSVYDSRIDAIESGSANAVKSVNGKIGDVILGKSDINLGLVDNTSDANKPISAATQIALNGKEPTINLGTTAQYWRGDKSWQTLNKSTVGLDQVDNTSDSNKPISSAAQLALNAKANDSSVVHKTGDEQVGGQKEFIDPILASSGIQSADNIEMNGNQITNLGNPSDSQDAATKYYVDTSIANSPSGVSSVNGKTGAVVLNKSDINLGNVDNTSDLTKPISSATQTALDSKGARAGVKPDHYNNQPFTYYDNFLTGWSDYYAKGTITTDTSIVTEGASSTKIVTNTPVAAGEWCGVSKAVTMDLSKSAFRLMVYSPDWSKVGGVDIGFSTNGDYVASFNAGVNGLTSPQNNEWIEVLVTRSRCTTNGAANWATVNNIVVRAQGKVGQQATVYVSGFATLPMAVGGVCSITFDDGFDTDITTAKPYLDKYGFRATSFIIQDRIGLAGRMTDDNIRTLHDSGWDISSHTYSHPNLSTLSESDLHTQFRSLKDYLVDNGYRGADVLAYPQSVTSNLVKKVLRKYHSYARTASRFGQPRTYIVPQSLMATDVSSATVTQSIKDAIDAAKNDGEWLILIFHGVKSSPGTADVTPAVFYEIIDYLAASGLAVETMSQVLENPPLRGVDLVGPAGTDATTAAKGIIRLTNDLGGTSVAPTVVATHLAAALPINQGGTGSTTQPFVDLTTSQTVAGAKIFTSKTIVGVVGDPQSGNNLDVDGAIGVLKKSADQNPAAINFYKRGTTGDATVAVANAASLGSISAYGWNGTGYMRHADMNFTATENWSSTARGTRQQYFTTPNGTSTRQEVLRLDQDRAVVFFGTLRPNATLTQDIGVSNNYVSNLYAQRHYLNATAYIDGAIAGAVALTGSLSTTGSATIGTNLIMPSTSTGIALYNTTDQTTNYERLRIATSTNTYAIIPESGGTGTIRDIIIGNTRTLKILNAQATAGSFQFSAALSTAGAMGTVFSGSLTASSGSSSVVSVSPTIAQTSTASTYVIESNPTITTLGSGGVRLFSGRVAGVDKWYVDSTGTMALADAANIVLGTISGTKIGTSTSQLIGLWNKTPVAQPVLATDFAYTTTNATTLRTIDADSATIDSLADFVSTLAGDLQDLKNKLKQPGFIG